MSNKYQEAGVDVKAGYESVQLIKEDIKRTSNQGVVSSIGGFASVFDLNPYNFKHPLLVSGTDGVGTKVELAKQLDKLDTIGIDLVAMCVNDIICIGAKPLYFLDYIAFGKNEPLKTQAIIKGICDGLVLCDTALVGGEMAEMPGVYLNNSFDLAGFVVGAVEKDQVITNENINNNDILIGLPSSGIHANGYSLVRKIIKDHNLDLNKIYPELDSIKSLGDILLTPTRIYVNETLALIKEVPIKGISHITGGGFYENVKRITKDKGASIYQKQYPLPSIFTFLKDKANLNQEEMYGYFNMGIGLVYCIDPNDKDIFFNALDRLNIKGYEIGHITKDKSIKVWL